MKKILFACDGKNLPKGAFEFIKELQQEEPILLTGAFLHAMNFELLLPGLFAMAAAPALEFLEEEKNEFKHTIAHFREMCEHNGIEYIVHEESQGWNTDDLAKETRFADFMVMSEELFCTEINPNEPNGFMQAAIHKAECPVMLFPETFKPFKKIIIAYDGKKDSMFALKEFCNLFPNYKNIETKIVYARDENKDDMPDMVLVEEFAGRHFTNLDFEKLYFNGKNHFNEWPNEYRDALIVSGSFGRGALSNFIKKSFVDDTIQQHSNPLFIAHH